GGGGERRVLYRPRKEAQAGIEKGRINAVQIHVRNPRMGIKPTLAPFGILHANWDVLGMVPLAINAFAHANRPNQSQSRRRAKQLAFHQKSLFAFVIHDEIRRPVAVLRVNVLPPKMPRFQHMAVGINNVIRASHSFPPLHSVTLPERKRTFSDGYPPSYCNWNPS